MSLRFTKFDAHRAKAAHNIAVATALAGLPEDAQDWQITALFYAGVHLIQAYFAARHTAPPPSWSGNRPAKPTTLVEAISDFLAAITGFRSLY